VDTERVLSYFTIQWVQSWFVSIAPEFESLIRHRLSLLSDLLLSLVFLGKLRDKSLNKTTVASIQVLYSSLYYYSKQHNPWSWKASLNKLRRANNKYCIITERVFSHLMWLIWGPFEKFVDSPNYSESELCGWCGDGLFFEVPPLASDALLTTLHPLLQNVLQTIDNFEISCLGAPVSWVEKPRNGMERDLNWILCSAWKKWIGGTPLEHSLYSPDLAPCDFWAFPTMKRELRGKKFRSV
jgi:hypothetical protein